SGARPTGYGSATVGPDRSSVLDIRLAEPAAIRGRVVAAAGGPIAGAEVYCELSETELPLSAWPGFTSELCQTVVTDEDGTYTMEGLIAGQWSLSAHAEGYARRTAGVRVPEAGQRVQAPDLVLGRLVRLAGRVLMPDGKTPAGNRALKVRLQLGGSGERGVTTDAEGRFVIPDVPPTIQRLEFRTEGLAPVQVVVESPEVARDGLEVRLLAFGAIRGTLRRTDGELPGDGVYIVAGSPGLRMWDWAPPRGSSRSLQVTKLVPPEPRGVIEGVPPGRRGLQVIGDGVALLERTDVTVPEGGVAQVDREVSGGGSIAGRVTTVGGEPVAGARVRVRTEGLQIGQLEPSATTDQDGRYVLDHVTPGLRRVEVSAAGFADARLDDVTVGEGLTWEDVDFELLVVPE
ncbi:MAG: carboxypeptidase regulatory-like domain-containing protein, partial [Armatimonadota bacterium]